MCSKRSVIHRLIGVCGDDCDRCDSKKHKTLVRNTRMRAKRKRTLLEIFAVHDGGAIMLKSSLASDCFIPLGELCFERECGGYHKRCGFSWRKCPMILEKQATFSEKHRRFFGKGATFSEESASVAQQNGACVAGFADVERGGK
mgnify:CR=1 FL=1